jgi:hypothetical protein
MATTNAQTIAKEGNGQQTKAVEYLKVSLIVLVAANRHNPTELPSEGQRS